MAHFTPSLHKSNGTGGVDGDDPQIALAAQPQHYACLYRHTPGHVIDIVPTILELTGGHVPTQHHGKPVPTPPGRSLVSAFHEDVTIERDYLWWFHDGHKAVRIGDWKAVALSKGAWELYNLADDRAESNDLAHAGPGKLKELVAMWDRRMAEFTQLALQDLPKP